MIKLIQKNLARVRKKKRQLCKFKHAYKVLTRNWQSLTISRLRYRKLAI